MTEKELTDAYIQEPISKILCQSCCDLINFCAITNFEKDSRLQFLFCNLVVAHIIHQTRKKIITPKWVPEDMVREFAVLEIYRSVGENGQLCFQHLVQERGFVKVFEDCITWTRDWSKCPYNIEENKESKSFAISVYHDNFREEGFSGKDMFHHDKKMLH